MVTVKDFYNAPNAWVLNLNRGRKQDPCIKMVMVVKRGRKYIYTNECIDECYMVPAQGGANYLASKGDSGKKIFRRKEEAEEYLEKYQLIQSIKRIVSQLGVENCSISQIKEICNILNHGKT
ncbi:hypothetical protein VSQ48_20105 [Candidatus Ventrimonas sp. KK005]